jgi:hypothetical protein
MSLAKALAKRISESDVERKWPKLKGGTKRKLSGKLDQFLADIVNATAPQLIADTLAEMPISTTESIPTFVGLLIVPQGVLGPHLQRPCVHQELHRVSPEGTRWEAESEQWTRCLESASMLSDNAREG